MSKVEGIEWTEEVKKYIFCVTGCDHSAVILVMSTLPPWSFCSVYRTFFHFELYTILLARQLSCVDIQGTVGIEEKTI